MGIPWSKLEYAASAGSVNKNGMVVSSLLYNHSALI